MRKEGSASYAIADSDYEGGRKGNVWQNTPAHCSIHFDIRQDGRMGPAVVISVVRRSRSHLKKKLRYESVQLREYRGILQNPPARQMVSVIHQFILFFSISHVEMPRVIPARACCLLGAPIFKNRMAAAGLRNARRALYSCDCTTWRQSDFFRRRIGNEIHDALNLARNCRYL